MRRDFPRDDHGLPLRGSKRELVVDPRPTKMIEDKKKYEQNYQKRDRRFKFAKKATHVPRKEVFAFSKGRWSFDPS